MTIFTKEPWFLSVFIRASSLIFLLLISTSVSAWNCDVHVGLSLSMQQSDFGIRFNSRPISPLDICPSRAIKPKDQAYPFRPKLSRYWRTYGDKGRFLDLVSGSHDPDYIRDRQSGFKLNPTRGARSYQHQNRASDKVRESFKKAKQEWQEGKHQNLPVRGRSDIQSGAFTRLGIAIHYLGDLSDFSKVLRSGSNSDDVRFLSDRMIGHWLNMPRSWPESTQTNRLQGIQIRISPAQKNQWLSEKRRAVSNKSIDELIDMAYAHRAAGRIAIDAFRVSSLPEAVLIKMLDDPAVIRGELPSATDGSLHRDNEILRTNVYKTFAFMVAAGERMGQLMRSQPVATPVQPQPKKTHQQRAVELWNGSKSVCGVCSWRYQISYYDCFCDYDRVTEVSKWVSPRVKQCRTLVNNVHGLLGSWRDLFSLQCGRRPGPTTPMDK